MPTVIENITPTTIIHTDSSHIYNPLEKDYKREVVNHNQQEYVRGNVHTNTIEGFWSLLKRGINGIHHSVSPSHLGRYCDEYAYRYNHRGLAQDEKFADVLSKCGGRLKYAELTGK